MTKKIEEENIESTGDSPDEIPPLQPEQPSENALSGLLKLSLSILLMGAAMAVGFTFLGPVGSIIGLTISLPAGLLISSPFQNREIPSHQPETLMKTTSYSSYARMQSKLQANTTPEHGLSTKTSILKGGAEENRHVNVVVPGTKVSIENESSEERKSSPGAGL